MGFGKSSTLASLSKYFTLNTFFSKHFFLAASLIIISTLPLIPSFYLGEPVMFQSHDHIFHLLRFWHIEKAFYQGIIMPDWINGLTYGFGSPIFLFSWYLPYYFGLPLRWLGLSLADTIKLLYLLSFIASGLAMYLLAKKITSKTAALISIPFYLLSPFRLNLIFTRGGFGAAWSQVLYPLIIFFTISKHRLSFVILTLLLSAQALTHNLSFILTIGVFLLWTIFVEKDPKVRKKNTAALMFSLLITAFFWLPAFFETKYIHYSEMPKNLYQNQFPSFRALLSSPWQYGPPQPEKQHLSMSFQIGKIHWLVIALTPLVIFLKKKLKKIQKRIVFFLILLFWGTIVFQLKISKPIWDYLDILKLFIFPWRIQAISVFSVALIASFLVYVLPHKKILILIFLILLLLANRNHFQASRGEYASDEYIKNLGHSGDSWGEFLPIWADLKEYGSFRKGSSPQPEGIVQLSESVKVVKQQMKGTKIMMDLQTDKESRVKVNHYYFPGWKGYLDGREIEINSKLEENKGKQNFLVPPGKHEILLKFNKTPFRKIATSISLTSVVGFLVLVFHKFNNDHEI